MKIAIPSKNNMVDGHFGHCEYFTIYSVNDDHKIEHEELFESPAECGCKSNLAGVLKQIGVTTMLAGGIGQGAINVLNQHGIEVYRGCSGNVRQLTEEFLKGAVVDSGETCSQHQHHHENEKHNGECRHQGTNFESNLI
jgi:predicted Fe-Mo cluster-binding NifX family protein